MVDSSWNRYVVGNSTVIHGDSQEVLRLVADDAVDSVVTDPPYALSFMGRSWDKVLPPIAIWKETLRVLKPGGHALVFGGTRTFHRLACSLEDAGFEIRDCLMWLYGSGMPKVGYVGGKANPVRPGWGGSLSPAWEPIALIRKPFVGTLKSNLQEYGTGALNIDANRIATEDNLDGGAYAKGATDRPDNYEGWRFKRGDKGNAGEFQQPTGRWPANVIMNEEAGQLLDQQAGTNRGQQAPLTGNEPRSDGMSGAVYGDGKGSQSFTKHDNGGGASRFFYQPKASPSERWALLKCTCGNKPIQAKIARKTVRNQEVCEVCGEAYQSIEHATVKPIDLMRYLVRLVTLENGVVLDPFAGSGSTGVAALREGFKVRLIERESDYVEMIRARVEAEK